MPLIQCETDIKSERNYTDNIISTINLNGLEFRQFNETEYGKTTYIDGAMPNSAVLCFHGIDYDDKEVIVYVNFDAYIITTEQTKFNKLINIQSINLLQLNHDDIYQTIEKLKLFNRIFHFSSKLTQAEKLELDGALEKIVSYDSLAFSDDVTDDEHLKYSAILAGCLEALLKKQDILIKSHKNSDFNSTLTA
jgi:hypothetical protein